MTYCGLLLLPTPFCLILLLMLKFMITYYVDAYHTHTHTLFLPFRIPFLFIHICHWKRVSMMGGQQFSGGCYVKYTFLYTCIFIYIICLDCLFRTCSNHSKYVFSLYTIIILIEILTLTYIFAFKLVYTLFVVEDTCRINLNTSLMLRAFDSDDGAKIFEQGSAPSHTLFLLTVPFCDSSPLWNLCIIYSGHAAIILLEIFLYSFFL